MNALFMGSGDFAFHPLKVLHESGHKVSAVFTAFSEGNSVYDFAQSSGIAVFMPGSLKDANTLELIAQIPADVIVVASYGKILPKEVLEAKKFGAVNIHPSRLPKFRGPSPIQSTILAGETSSSVCVIQMDQGVDTGPILLSADFSFAPSMHASQLEELCSTLGAKLLVEALDNLCSLVPIPQESIDLVPSVTRKIKKSSGRINWKSSAMEIERMVRAFSNWPSAFFFHNGELIKILEAKFEMKIHECEPGTVMNECLLIACGEGFLRPTSLQRQGRKVLSAEAFLRGYKILVGTVLN